MRPFQKWSPYFDGIPKISSHEEHRITIIKPGKPWRSWQVIQLDFMTFKKLFGQFILGGILAKCIVESKDGQDASKNSH